MAGGGAQLLERGDELALIDSSLLAAQAGRGAMTLVEGPPGIGKTELLAAAVRRARESKMLVVSARAGELERSYPYAVVRQLFEGVVGDADLVTRERLLAGAAVHAGRVIDPRAEAASTPIDASAVLHGLYWLTANLAADCPLAVVIDDLHWSDPASVSWLVYLARRIEGLAIALIVGTRPGEPGASEGLLDSLRATDGLALVCPAPLSQAGVDGLARTVLGRAVAPAFTQACHAVTGGNPFYVAELLRALREDRVEGTAADTRVIEGLTPRAVVDATLARLGRLPPAARTVAEAAALLVPNAELRWTAALTGLDVDVVAEAVDSLLRLGLLGSVGPVRFAHPILRSAVEAEISPARRGRLHLRAARILAAAEMPVDTVAAHLMQTPPIGEPWIAAALVQAARRASGRGAPGGAVAYLERGLAERPGSDERRELLLELGKAESQIHSPSAASHLREALALATEPEEIAGIALWLGQALFHTGSLDEAFEMLSGVIDRADRRGGDPMLELEAYQLSIASAAGKLVETARRAASLGARTPGSSGVAGAVAATLALRDVCSGVPRERVRVRLERAVAAIEHGGAESSPHLSDRTAPALVLIWIDELDRALALQTQLLTVAARMGRLQTFEIFSAQRGFARHRRGDLANAAADVEPILTGTSHSNNGFAVLIATIAQVRLLIDDGRPDVAEQQARSAEVPRGFTHGFMTALLRHGQGAAQLAQGRFGDAAATLTEVGDLCEADGIRSPAAFPWRSDLALALARTDRHAEAIELAREEVRLAERCDVDRARGVALRALGLVQGGQSGLEHLARAVQALERSPARLESGWANYELGAALRRANRRRDARVPLDRALDIGLACGARLLRQRCADELKALGARARKVMLSGAESLTASERRVCALAADGLKNAEIAQALFVTLKTVETHLRSSYRKLDITSRGELPAILGREDG